jgi:hypothetical protein
MRGKDCVAIASDLRYGVQLQTVDTNFPVSAHDAVFSTK